MFYGWEFDKIMLDKEKFFPKQSSRKNRSRHDRTTLLSSRQELRVPNSADKVFGPRAVYD